MNYYELIKRIKELSDTENIFETDQMLDNLESIHKLIEKIENENVHILSQKEEEIISACIEVVDDLPIGFEAIDGYVDLDDEAWTAIEELKEKF